MGMPEIRDLKCLDDVTKCVDLKKKKNNFGFQSSWINISISIRFFLFSIFERIISLYVFHAPYYLYTTYVYLILVCAFFLYFSEYCLCFFLFFFLVAVSLKHLKFVCLWSIITIFGLLWNLFFYKFF